jgi:hypothetical protein
MKSPLTTICFLAAAVAPAARAGIIQTTPDDFAVFAGGSLSLDRGAAVTGPVGAVGGGYLDRDVRVSQGVYSGSKLTTGRDARIGGGLVSAGNVYLDRGTSVATIDSGGSVGLGSGVQVGGYVAADGRVDVQRHASIGGDVSYGTGEWISGGATVGGTVAQRLRTVTTWQTTLPDEPAWTGGGGGAWYGRGEDVTLAPGTYGSVSADRDATVRLSAGTYDLGSMWLGRDTEVVADTSGGDVRLNLSGSLSTDSEVTFSKSGDGALLVRADDFIYLGKETQAQAGFTSFRRLDVDKASMISGRIQSTGDVWIGRDAEVRGPMGGHPIPEPAGLAFLAGGLVAILTGRWIRRD